MHPSAIFRCTLCDVNARPVLQSASHLQPSFGVFRHGALWRSIVKNAVYITRTLSLLEDHFEWVHWKTDEHGLL